MLKIGIDNVINQIVETMLPRFTKDKVLIINFHAQTTVYGEKGDEDKYGNINVVLLYYRPSNYTQVYGYMSRETSNLFELEAKDFQYLSDHDSCWRGDGTERFVRKAYFDLKSQVENMDNVYVSFDMCYPILLCPGMAWHDRDTQEFDIGWSIQENQTD